MDRTAKDSVKEMPQQQSEIVVFGLEENRVGDIRAALVLSLQDLQRRHLLEAKLDQAAER